MLKTNTTTTEKEAKRIASIPFLYSTKNAADHRADAAEAESSGDYQNARACLQTTKGDLRNIEVNPALPLPILILFELIAGNGVLKKRSYFIIGYPRQ